MSTITWVCFECRVTLRRKDQKEPLCPKCGEKCFNMGYKTLIPSKSKAQEWENLQEQLFLKHREEEKINLPPISNKHTLEWR